MSWLSRRGYLVACLTFVAGWAVLGAPWLTGAVTIPYDAKAHFQAQVQFLAHAIHSGQSPFWAPNVFAGSPQIADPQSLIFSPALLLALVNPTPSFQAVDALVLTTLALGGLAIIAFFHDRGWHPAGAVVAALVFAFGASAAWRIQHVGQIESYVFFGVTLWLLARALDRVSWRWGIAAGVGAGLMAVKPDQVAFLGALVLLGYAVDHLLRGGGLLERIRRATPALSAAAVTGAAIIAAPMLLTMLFAANSNRTEFTFLEAARGSLHPASLLTMAVADLFGALDPKVEFWGPSSSSWNAGEISLSQNMGQMYLGAIPAMAMLAFGVARGHLLAPRVRLFTIAFVALIFYTLGWYTPVFRLMFEYVPGVSVFRRPADATFIIGALAAIMSGYCVHQWLADAANGAKGWVCAAGVALAALLVGGSLIVAISLGRTSEAIGPILTSSLWLAAGAAALVAMRRLRALAPLLPIPILAMLLVADLRANNGPNESTGLPPSHYDVLDPATKNETIRFLKERLAQNGPSDRRDRVELVGLGFAWPNAGLVHGFDHTLGYNPLRLAEFSDATGAGDTIAGPEQRNFTRVFPRYNCKLANLLGLRYIVSSVPIEKVDTHFRAGDLQFIKRTTDGYIYENPRARARVMFAQEWRLTDFDALAESGRWPEFDASKTVLLESDPASAHPYLGAPSDQARLASASDDRAVIAAIPSQSEPARPSKVLITRYENTEVEIFVDAAQSGFVVLNDVWHPWWVASLDGRPAPILKANLLFRAVQVPAGRHMLRFSFNPFRGAIAELGDKLTGEE